MAMQRSSYLSLTRETQPLASTNLLNIPQFRDIHNNNNNNSIVKVTPCNGPTKDRRLFYVPQSIICGNENGNGLKVCGASQKILNYQSMPKLSFEDVPDNVMESVNADNLMKLAKDRDGIQMLLSHFPASGNVGREKLFATVLQPSAFSDLIDHSSGNYLIQKMIEMSTECELIWIERLLSNQLLRLCLGCYGCRVVQKMIERIKEACPVRLPNFISFLAGHEFQLATSQTGSHVLQKIFSCTSFETYEFILKCFAQSDTDLESVVEDKYGCRVIQLALQQLKGEITEKQCQRAEHMFNKIIGIMKQKTLHFISHQYANYIMQDLLCLEMENFTGHPTIDFLRTDSEKSRRNIITFTILSNLLSLSQEKHASHVVEKAFQVAPERVLCAMMDEIFEGYECDRDGNDALHVLMFDQFGNYVVQTMIDVALEVHQGVRKGKIEWYSRLVERVTMLRSRLTNFSSGKRIIEKFVKAGALSYLDSGCQTSSFPIIPAQFR